jgi:hypothetical protein
MVERSTCTAAAPNPLAVAPALHPNPASPCPLRQLLSRSNTQTAACKLCSFEAAAAQLGHCCIHLASTGTGAIQTRPVTTTFPACAPRLQAAPPDLFINPQGFLQKLCCPGRHNHTHTISKAPAFRLRLTAVLSCRPLSQSQLAAVAPGERLCAALPHKHQPGACSGCCSSSSTAGTAWLDVTVLECNTDPASGTQQQDTSLVVCE